MSMVSARRRQLAKSIRNIKRKEGKASLVETLGKEVGSAVTAYGEGTADIRAEKKNITKGAEIAGVDLEEKNLSIFGKSAPLKEKGDSLDNLRRRHQPDMPREGWNKDFFKNWGQKLNLIRPDDKSYTTATGSSYTTDDLQTLGQLKSSKSGIVKLSLAEMEKQGKPLSSVVGTHKTPEPVQTPSSSKSMPTQNFLPTNQPSSGLQSQHDSLGAYRTSFGLNPTGTESNTELGKLNRPMSSIIDSGEFQDSTASARRNMLNESQNNSIDTSTTETSTIETPPEEEVAYDPNNPLGHSWGGGYMRQGGGFGSD